MFGYAIAVEPVIGIVGNQLRVLVEQNLWANDVQVEVEISDDLERWTVLPAMSAGNNGDGTRTLSYVSADVDVTVRQFVRLKVIQK